MDTLTRKTELEVLIASRKQHVKVCSDAIAEETDPLKDGYLTALEYHVKDLRRLLDEYNTIKTNELP